MTESRSKVRESAGLRAAGVVLDWLVAAVLIWAAGRLAAWPWSTLGYVSLVAGWGAVLAVGAVWRARSWRGSTLVELIGTWMVLAGTNLWHATVPLPAGRLAYGLALVVVGVAGWRAWRWRSVDVVQEPIAEPARVLLVAAGALWVLWPMTCDRFLGGTDARWYAFMLHDFITQWRTSGPPVFLGLGEYVWNGAVHPFRSAPVYMHVAGVWDWLTLRSLGTTALQHLTVLSAALAGAWGVYAAGVKLAPRRRWEVAALAALYVLAPASLMSLYMADAYMTYMASAAFVWVFYGNARVLVDGRGWISLAAGLSLAWMCHPPTAMQVTLISACLQLGGFAAGSCRWADWRKGVAAGVVFILLSAYYFTSMSELPPRPADGNLGEGLLQVVAMMFGWLVATRAVVAPREWQWWWLLGPVAAILWFTSPMNLAWLGLTLALVPGIAGAMRRWHGGDPAGHAPVLVATVVLLTAGGMHIALSHRWLGAGFPYPVQVLRWPDFHPADYFAPLSAGLNRDSDTQPGWGLWLAGLLAAWGASRRGATAAQFMFAVLILLLPMLLHVPGLGLFLLEALPGPLVGMTGFAMELRMMPVYAALLAITGVLGLRAEQAAGSAGLRRAIPLVALLAALGWAGWEGRRFVQRGWDITASTAMMEKDWRTENAPMDRFVYDLLPIPSYFSHGKMDPRLEVRLLDDRGNLIYGPLQITEAMEAAGAQVFSLETLAIHDNPQWLQLEPRFVLQPGEHRLMRFTFDPNRRYAGYLLVVSEHGYREYLLPESGLPRAFGTGPEQGHVLSLWNSGSTPEHGQLQFLLQPGHDLAPGMHFAKVTMSEFQAARALIEVKSLNPWRVETRLPWSGQLETSRVYLPGYEVRVDGRRIGPARISSSPNRLLQIAMPPGEHVVEVKYIGTLKLRLAGLISLATWAALLVARVLRERTFVGRLLAF